ncbi:MAG: metal-dependent hydrolase, partial [Candidatus Levyibacteriota bacterium]
MTGRTHDLAAFTALNYIIAITVFPHITLSTAIFAFGANMIGGIAPDIDQPTADLWKKLPAGFLYSRVFTTALGGHRHISHSLLGIVIFGFGSMFLLSLLGKTILVNMDIVWFAFMVGFLSHLIMDTFTREGVPWLFPVPLKL